MGRVTASPPLGSRPAGDPPPRRPSATPRVRAAVLAGRAAALASRTLGRGEGGVIGGRVIMALAPDAAGVLARGRTSLLVSGTNGKTTTTAYLTAAMRTGGPVDTNADGANTRPGITRAVAGGKAPTLVLETDEGWIPWALQELKPAAAVLLNLSRDQLHRHHEVARLATTWHNALGDCPHVVANADDPAVVMAASAAVAQTWVGTDVGWTGDTTVCPQCGDQCLREDGDWRCRSCPLRRPQPDWWLEDDEVVSASQRIRLDLALPGAANRSNAAIAIATAAHFGRSPEDAARAIGAIVSVADRYQVYVTPRHRSRLMLAKNPASWAQALSMVAEAGTPVVLAFNSEGVDGLDPSWLYDVPFRALAGRPIVVTGRRATDMAVRLEMDGLTDVRLADDVAAAIAMQPDGEVTVLANYTAFQDARKVLRA